MASGLASFGLLSLRERSPPLLPQRYQPSLNIKEEGSASSYRSYQGVTFLRSNVKGSVAGNVTGSVAGSSEGEIYPLMLLAENYPDVMQRLFESYGLNISLTDIERLDLLWLLVSSGVVRTWGNIVISPERDLNQFLLDNWVLTPSQRQKVSRYNRGIALFCILTGKYVPHARGPYTNSPYSSLAALNLCLINGLLTPSGMYDFAPSTSLSWFAPSVMDSIASVLTIDSLNLVTQRYGLLVPILPPFAGLYQLLLRLDAYRTVILRPVMPPPPLLSGPVYPPLVTALIPGQAAPSSTQELYLAEIAAERELEVTRSDLTLALYSDSEVAVYYHNQDLSGGSVWWYNPDYPGVLAYGLPVTPSVTLSSSISSKSTTPKGTAQIYGARELEAAFRVYTNALGLSARRFPVPKLGRVSTYSATPCFNIYSLSNLLSVVTKYSGDTEHPALSEDISSLRRHLSKQLEARREENSVVARLIQSLPVLPPALVDYLSTAFTIGMYLRGWKGPSYDWPYSYSHRVQRPDTPSKVNKELPLLSFDWFTGYVTAVRGGSSLQRLLTTAGITAMSGTINNIEEELSEAIINCSYAYLFLLLRDVAEINLRLYEVVRRLKKSSGMKIIAPIYYDFVPALMR